MGEAQFPNQPLSSGQPPLPAVTPVLVTGVHAVPLSPQGPVAMLR